MVIRLGKNGRFLSCSLWPEHRESRPLPGEEPEQAALAGEGETCPLCGQGTLVQKRGRFGPFVGCDRYPECTYIRKEGPPPPEPLPFEVTCPTCKEGHLVARRARRTGSVFWGCSRYPKCRFTTSREPVGAVHDADGGPVARNNDGSGICLACGASIELPEQVAVGEVLQGGAPNAAALAPAGRGGRRPARTGSGRTGGTRSGAGRASRRAAKPAA
jgi:ssDNA-binding Zn-finger/Zn-ribbon topoisomerase 1